MTQSLVRVVPTDLAGGGALVQVAVEVVDDRARRVVADFAGRVADVDAVGAVERERELAGGLDVEQDVLAPEGRAGATEADMTKPDGSGTPLPELSQVNVGLEPLSVARGRAQPKPRRPAAAGASG